MKRVLLLAGAAVVSLLCFTPVFAADGFAEGVTGGAGGTIVIVSNAADFEYYARRNSPYIIEVLGTIDLNTDGVGGKVNIKPNKTIRGIGSNPTIIGNLAFENDYPVANVIIEELNITNPDDYGEGDGITIKWVSDIFITKCTVYECADGCIDITRESDYITVSWCKFHYVSQPDHRFVNLIGGGDSHTGDRGKLHCTFHHNWYSSDCDQRMPRVRFGQVHVYNNYFDCPGNDYCIRSDIEAQNLIENNYFDHVDEPIEVKDHLTALIEASGNIFDTCTGARDDGDDDVFDPPYSYTLDNASSVPSIVTAGTGASEWLYGDFTDDDIVDIDDLPYFLAFWLEDDCNETAGLDVNDDCIINYYEFSLLAWNWLEEAP